MSKTDNLIELLDELADCGKKLLKTATALKEHLGEPASTDTEVEAATTPEAEATFTKEQIRERLAQAAAMCDNKYKAQVKELVRKYADGGSLKDIPESRYSELVAELEVMTDD